MRAIWPFKQSQYTQKMVLLATLPVVLMSVFSLALLHYKLNGFSQQSADISTGQLQTIYQNLLQSATDSVSDKINLRLNHIENELVTLAQYAQTQIDHNAPATATVTPLIYNPTLNTSANAKNPANIVIQVWGEQHHQAGQIDAASRAFIDQMQPAFSLLSTLGAQGSDKSWSYFLGPKHAPVTIVYPWSELAQTFHQLYPEFKQQNWWDYFYPGAMEAWAQGLQNGTFDKHDSRPNITWTPLYEDAAGAGTTLTFWAPLWTAARDAVAGVAGFDFNVNAIIDLVKNERVGENGYVFLMKQNGDIIGLTEQQLAALSLVEQTGDTQSVRIGGHNLTLSANAELATIAQHQAAEKHAFYAFNDQQGQGFLIRFKALRQPPVWSPQTESIERQTLYVVGIVPQAEVLSIQHQLNSHFVQLKDSTRAFLVGASILFALLTLMVAGIIAWRNTLQIRHITRALTEANNPNSEVKVEVVSHDELGRLADSFNTMFEQTRQAHNALEAYAQSLEEKVKQRTLHLEQANQKLHELSQRDGLTGVYNRHYLEQHAPDYWQDYVAQRQPLSVLMIDIDYFKKYNDRYGHQMGDACLVEVAHSLVQHLPPHQGFIARYGGEEFIALVNIPHQQAWLLAETLRQHITHLHLEHLDAPQAIVTLSIGIASAEHSGATSLSELIKFADIALYQSKAQGRNRVSLFNSAITSGDKR